jgi:two-component system, sensor histidine kinase LadS
MPVVRFFGWLRMLLVLVCWPLAAQTIAAETETAEPVLIIKSADDWLYIRSGLDILEDPLHTLGIEDMPTARVAASFQPWQGKTLNMGFSRSVFWVRMRVLNLNPDNNRLYLKDDFASIDFIDAYQFTNKGVMRQSAGDRVPVSRRNLHTNSPSFEITAPAGKIQTVYLRIQGDGNLKIPLTLFGNKAFDDNTRLEISFLGVYFGALAIMMLLNLGLFIFSRNPDYLSYSVLVCVQMFFLSCWEGIANYLFWPESPEISRYALLASLGATTMALVPYAMTVLQTRRYHPVNHRLLQMLFIAGAIQIVLALMDAYPWAGIFSFPLTILGHIFLVFVAATTVRRGCRTGILFMIGWSTTLTGVLLTSLSGIGLLAANWITENLFNAGWVLEAFVFSILLAHRTGELTRKNERHIQARLQSEREAEAKRLLLEEVSHEIKTPLHGVSGSAELLASTILSSNQRRYCDQIQASVASITRMVDSTLAFSRLRDSRFEPELSPCHIHDCIHNLVLITESLITRPTVKFSLDAEPQMPEWVLTDSGRISQITLNLLGNAVKYTESGLVSLRIGWSEERLEIAVTDTGPGIPADRLEDIFTPYFRLESAIAGTGLGLPICKQTVENLGGEMHVQSAPGAGSTFYLSIPAPACPAPAPLSPASTSISTLLLSDHASPPPSRTIRILVVDDLDLNLTIARDLLLLDGHQVATAHNPIEVTEYLSHHRIDLILMDIRLQDCNGAELAQTLRTSGLISDTTMIAAMTASAQSHNIRHYIRCGIQPILVKPVTRNKLRQLVAHSIHHEQAVETLQHARFDPTLVQELIELVGAQRVEAMAHDLQKNVHMLLQQLQETIREQDPQQWSALTHRLAGACRQLGLNAAAELAEPDSVKETEKGRLKRALNQKTQDNPENRQGILTELEKLTQTALQELHQYIKTRSVQTDAGDTPDAAR